MSTAVGLLAQASGVGELLPGLLVAGVVAAVLGAAFLLGIWSGRQIPRRSIRTVEKSIRSMIAGDFRDLPDVEEGDPASSLANAARQLADTLRDRAHRVERRAVSVGEALDHVHGQGLAVLDRDMSVMTASEGLGRLIGVPAVDLEGRMASSLFSEWSWRELLAALFETPKRTEGVVRTLELIRAHDEGMMRVEVLATGIMLPVEGFALMIQPAGDEDRDAELNEARLEAERARVLYEAVSDGVMVVAGGRVTYANPTIASWLELDPVDRELKDLVAAEEMFVVLDGVSRAARGEAVDPVRCRLFVADDAERMIHVEAHVVPADLGEERVAVMTLRDLGLELAAMERARLQESRLRSVVDAVSDGIVVSSSTFGAREPAEVSLLNAPARRLLGGRLRLGSGRSDLESAVAASFVEGEAIVELIREAERDDEGRAAGRFDAAGLHGGTFDVVVRDISDPARDMTGSLIVFRDVTDTVESERTLVDEARALESSRRSLQRAYEELSEMNRSMRTKSGQLDEVNRELRTLDDSRAEILSTISHDLQAPLASIRGYAQMMQEGRFGRINDEQKQGLGKVIRNVDRMGDLIENLLAMARAESGSELSPGRVRAVEVVRDVFERLASVAEQKGLTLSVEEGSEGLSVLAERDGLKQVVENLVSNGIKFSPSSKGLVRVELLSGPGAFVTIRVSDNGPGVPASEREKVFERFYRGSGSVGIAGSGIGLATVKSIVERHGGRVELESGDGDGASFRVLWPRSGAGEGSGRAIAG